MLLWGRTRRTLILTLPYLFFDQLVQTGEGTVDAGRIHPKILRKQMGAVHAERAKRFSPPSSCLSLSTPRFAAELPLPGPI